jgi:hypothetical protein
LRGFICPRPWHELVDARGGPQIGELCHHVGEIGVRLDAVELAGLCRHMTHTLS